MHEMHTDRLLTTVLRAYHRQYTADAVGRLLSTTTSLLTILSNPLNLTLLTSQLLLAPAIWPRATDLDACLSILSVFSNAATQIRKHELEAFSTPSVRKGGGLCCDDWARAVVEGADDRSARWQHLLVIGGVLIGMKSDHSHGLSHGLTLTLETALIKATNLALGDLSTDDRLGAAVIVLVSAHTVPLISDAHKRTLNYDMLTPIMVKTMIRGEGYQEGHFLGAIDADIQQVREARFDWSPGAPSFQMLQKLATRPLISVMGPLARVIAFGIENISDSRHVSAILNDLLAFTGILTRQWRRTRLSGIEPAEELLKLTNDALRITLPTLWQVLKTAMFATTIILGAVIGRTLLDSVLSADTTAPSMASRTLHVLRNIHFISSRLGTNAFSALTFVHLTSIDILSRFPAQSRDFLTEIQPLRPGYMAIHPLEKNHDLYYFNTCEQFTLQLSPEDSEALIVSAVLPYIKDNGSGNLLEVFEAAHSAMLAVLAAPQNTRLASKLIPVYTEILFWSFPTTLSPRQFRFAFKTLLHITTPPAPLSQLQPELPDTIMELLDFKARRASIMPLPTQGAAQNNTDSGVKYPESTISEQAVFVLTLLDALPFLQYSSLDGWLPLAADLLNTIEDVGTRNLCRARFWEVLENGEMDIERAAVAVGWWTSKGGRESVLYGKECEPAYSL